jgi:hypothetical protein
MHAVALLHRWLGKGCPSVHAGRRGALVKVVEALLVGGKLALTHLGRNLRSAAFAKHSIKRVDRLLGNRHLAGERLGVYRAIARWLLSASPRPVLIVDWADCAPGRQWLMLRAAVPLGGRTVSVYEEVHPLSRYNSPRTHRRFLCHLKAVLPEGCRPIVLADAGFRGPWFRAVESCGWDWVGRVRNKVKYSFDGHTWAATTSLYPAATPRVRYLGWGWLSHKRPYGCGLYLVRKYVRGRGRPRKTHGQGPGARRCRKLHKDPWLLVTSLPHDRHTARRLVNLYALRMRIEEGIRDTKSHRFGFGLTYARSHSAVRLELLLLIGTLATVLCHLHGLAAIVRNYLRHFQANTERRRMALSLFFLGRQLIHSLRFRLRRPELIHAAREIPNLIAAQAQLA